LRSTLPPSKALYVIYMYLATRQPSSIHFEQSASGFGGRGERGEGWGRGERERGEGRGGELNHCIDIFLLKVSILLKLEKERSLGSVIATWEKHCIELDCTNTREILTTNEPCANSSPLDCHVCLSVSIE